MMTIARFNWPYYVVAVAVLMASVAGWLLLAGALKVASLATSGGALYFIVISLGVSHLVYDRSDLYRWSWLDRPLKGAPVRQVVFCHAGFDECSADLRQRFGDAQWTMLDHFDAERMTEPSIRRARALFPPTPGTQACRYDTWPLEEASADVEFGLLAVHELRSEPERTAWFAEAKRCLRPGGRVVLAEHARDAANFLAFGPGFLHFHSCASWRRCWEHAGLSVLDHFWVTPFVQVFVLTAA